jgi:hypothetical protein
MPADYVAPTEPAFLGSLRQLLKETHQFLNTFTQGTAIVRLEPAEKPLPTVTSLKRLTDGKWIDDAIAPSGFVRDGARWATWFLPHLSNGTYRIRVQHRERRYVAEFTVQAPFTTLVELDGDGRTLTADDEFADARSLAGENAGLASDLVRGVEVTSSALQTRRWHIAGEIRTIEISPPDDTLATDSDD